ncbi:hypothetical protein A2U01_0104569, partial [Trifolium medium]|nr:hypothetical protein [Trifolium medium]
NRKAVRLAKEAARLARLEEDTSEEEDLIELADQEQNSPPPPPPRRTLGDYGMRNNGEIANLGFQPVNPVAFDI